MHMRVRCSIGATLAAQHPIADTCLSQGKSAVQRNAVSTRPHPYPNFSSYGVGALKAKTAQQPVRLLTESHSSDILHDPPRAHTFDPSFITSPPNLGS
jgi:hypothetical protein